MKIFNVTRIKEKKKKGIQNIGLILSSYKKIVRERRGFECQGKKTRETESIKRKPDKSLFSRLISHLW